MLQKKAGWDMYDDIEQTPLIKPRSKHQTVQMEEHKVRILKETKKKRPNKAG